MIESVEQVKVSQALLPPQKWFFDEIGNFGDPNLFNMETVIQFPTSLESGVFKDALKVVIKNNPSLRSYFRQKNNEWFQYIKDEIQDINEFAFEKVNLLSKEYLEVLDEVGEYCKNDKIQNPFSIEVGKMLRLLWFEPASDESVFIWLRVHHLIADAASLKLILNEIMDVYHQLLKGDNEIKPKPAVKSNEIVQKMNEFVDRHVSPHEFSYWAGLPWNQISHLSSLKDFRSEENKISTLKKHVLVYSKEETAKILGIKELKSGEHISTEELLLCTLASTVLKYSSLIDIEVLNNARRYLYKKANVNVIKQIDWIALSGIFFLKKTAQLGLEGQISDILKQINDVPDDGLGFDMLLGLGSSEEQEEIKRLRKYSSGLSFNYWGNIHDLHEKRFLGGKFVDVDTGSWQDTSSQNLHSIMCVGFVTQDQLYIDFTYSENIYDKAFVENLAEDFKGILSDIIK